MDELFGAELSGIFRNFETQMKAEAQALFTQFPGKH
jgi:hypothetical protein